MGGEKEEGEKSWLRHPNSRPLFCSIAIQLWGLPLSLQGQLLVPWSPSESVSCLSTELPWCGGLLLSTPGSTKRSPMTATNAQNSGLQSSHLTPDVTLFWWQQRWGTSASPVTPAGTDRNDAAQGESLELLPTGLPPESPRHVSSGLRPSGIDSWALSLLQGPLPHHRSPANLSEVPLLSQENLNITSRKGCLALCLSFRPSAGPHISRSFQSSLGLHSSTLPFPLPLKIQCHPCLLGQLCVPGPWSTVDVGTSG